MQGLGDPTLGLGVQKCHPSPSSLVPSSGAFPTLSDRQRVDEVWAAVYSTPYEVWEQTSTLGSRARRGDFSQLLLPQSRILLQPRAQPTPSLPSKRGSVVGDPRPAELLWEKAGFGREQVKLALQDCQKPLWTWGSQETQTKALCTPSVHTAGLECPFARPGRGPMPTCGGLVSGEEVCMVRFECLEVQGQRCPAAQSRSSGPESPSADCS